MRTTVSLLSRVVFTLFFVPFAANLLAQGEDRTPKTLFGAQGPIDHGGWGGVSANLTSIMGHEALLVGARGGWLVDHGVTIGLAGHGLVTHVPNAKYDAYRIAGGDSLRRSSKLNLGYGGLLIEPIIAPMSPVHISLPIIIGAGGVGYETHMRHSPQHDSLELDFDSDYQAFFVVEPGLELEFNIVPLVRLGVGASYRYTTDLDLPETPKDALRGLSAGVSVKVGRF